MSSFEEKVKERENKVLTTWSDEHSSEGSSNQELTNLCLMAKEDDEVSSNISNPFGSKFTLDELYDAFNKLVEDLKKLTWKSICLKGKSSLRKSHFIEKGKRLLEWWKENF